MVWLNHVAAPTAAATTNDVASTSLTEIGIPARALGARTSKGRSPWADASRSSLETASPGGARVGDGDRRTIVPAARPRASPSRRRSARAIASIVETRPGPGEARRRSAGIGSSGRRSIGRPRSAGSLRYIRRACAHVASRTTSCAGGGTGAVTAARPRETAATRRRGRHGIAAIPPPARRDRRARCPRARGARAGPSSTRAWISASWRRITTCVRGCSAGISAHTHVRRGYRQRSQRALAVTAPGDSSGSRRSGRRTCRPRA